MSTASSVGENVLESCTLWFSNNFVDVTAGVSVQAPENFAVLSGSVKDSSLFLTWAASSHADSYEVFVDPPHSTITGAGNVETPHATIEGLKPNTEYKFTLFAVQNGKRSSPTVIVSRTALPPPTKISVEQDSVTHNSMVVRWSLVIGADWYTMEINPPAAGVKKGTKIFQQSKRLTALSPNTDYTITVFPVNYVGNGASISLKQTTMLPPPGNLRVIPKTVTPTSIGVKWDAVTSAFNYEVLYSLTAPSITIQNTFVILQKLQTDKEYVIRVATRNSAGLSEYQRISVSTLSACYFTGKTYTKDKLMCPAFCAREKVDIYGTNIYTTDSSICIAAIHAGLIDNGQGGLVTIIPKLGVNFFEGSTHNRITSEIYAYPHSAFQFGLQAPRNFTLLSVYPTNFSMQWLPVRGAQSYKVTILPGGNETFIDRNKLDFTGLQPNTNYSVIVIAYASEESSEASTFKLKTALPKPQDLHVAKKLSSSSRVTIIWKRVIGATFYKVKFVADGVDHFSNTTKDAEIIAHNLPGGTLFKIFVQPVNEVGDGSSTEIEYMTDLERPNVTVTKTTYNSIQLAWPIVTGASQYNVSIKPCCFSVKAEQNSYLLSDLSHDIEYTIEVKAMNQMRTSIPTVVVQNTALGPISNIRISPGSLSSNQTIIEWDLLPNAYEYKVEYEERSGRGYENDTVKDNFLKLQDLSPGTGYIVSVFGKNQYGLGMRSLYNFSTLLPEPSIIKMEYYPNRKTLRIFWNPVPRVLSYIVTIASAKNLNLTQTTKSTYASFLDVSSQLQYNLTLQARNSVLHSKNRRFVFDTQISNVPLVAACVWSGNQILVKWNAPGYQVVRFVISDENGEIQRIVPNKRARLIHFKDLNPAREHVVSIDFVSASPGAIPMHYKIGVPVKVSGAYGGLYNVMFFWMAEHSTAGYQLTLGNKQRVVNSSSVYWTNLEKKETYDFHIKPIGGKESNSLSFFWKGFSSSDDVNYSTETIKTTSSPAAKDEQGNLFWIVIIVIFAAVLTLLLALCITCICLSRKSSLIRNNGLCMCCR